MSEAQLQKMMKDGTAAKDIFNNRLDGHHHQQEFHRNTGSFIVELPHKNHSSSNKIQHPLDNKGGLTIEQRKDWDKLRKEYWKERAKTELEKRGRNDKQ